MTSAPHQADLPLRWVTPARWAESVLRDPLALLNDHAHLERKAATNALDLLTRWPDPDPPASWVGTMTGVARDEIEHLAIVLRLLSKRGGRMSREHRNDYAAGLRELVRKGEGPSELADRLMVSALIEARSCERFKLLAEHCPDEELAALYRDLFGSEAGHYRVFLELAMQLKPRDQVHRRWDDMLDAEAQIIAAQPQGVKMHSGCG